MTWLVITASVLVAGGVQSGELRYPVKEFPTLAACQQRLIEHNATGLYDGEMLKQVFELIATVTTDSGKHADEIHVQLHCEEPKEDKNVR